MPNLYQLKSSIDESASADEDDVLAVKTALNRIGYYDDPGWGISSYPDRNLFDAIQKFQTDFGLTSDRVMKPGGPTEKELAARSPIYRCVRCGGPHGGVYGPICHKCLEREQNS
ncbi:MAG: hypothetical protein CMM77_08150 [Rhodospirillaceae bacterium]|nr:hypothetical protein [Magnetovibrio sp.]MAY67084.1 hypothetical protein [Rhodospirillaceae bacterium]